MVVMEHYFKNLRAKIGHDEIIMSGVAGILFNEDRTAVLLQKRSDSSQDVWGIPGGMIPLNDTNSSAIIREFKEEMNLDIKPVSLWGVQSDFHIEFPSGDKAQIIGTLLEVEKIGGSLVVDGDETTDAEFVPLNPVPTMYNAQHQYWIDQVAAGNRGFFKN